MRNILLLLLILLGISTFAQEEIELLVPIDDETQMIKFQGVVQEEGTKYELFKRVIYWLNDTYKDPVRVTSVRDRETGKVVGSHRIRIYYWDNDSIRHIGGMVTYTFTVETKDNRYRYTIDELKLKSATNVPAEKWLDKDDPSYDPRWEGYLRQIVEFVNDWSTNLEEKMKPEPDEVEDDW